MSYTIDKLDEFMAAVTVEMDADNHRLREMYRHLRAHMVAQERALQKAIESNTENAREAESLAAEVETIKVANLVLRTELENVKQMWRETIDDKLILRNALHDIATNANGAEYGHWANLKAEKALRGEE